MISLPLRFESSVQGGGADSKRRIETTQTTLIQEIKGIKKKQKKQFVKFLLHQVKF